MAGAAPDRPKKTRLREEISASLDFAFFSVAAYIIFVALFAKPLLHPLRPATVPNATEEAYGNGTAAQPEYGISTATVLFILLAGLALGRVAEWATAPSLLGMLLAGIALKNVPLLSGGLGVASEWSSVLRRAAFVVILLRGGLSLDGEALKKMKGACLRLAFLPCTVEALAVALTSHLIFGIAPLFGLLLGFVLAAVSPAVVVPSMIRIAQDGYGSAVSSLVVAAASLDDVYAITLFSLALSVIFSMGDSIVWTLVRAPLEVVGGCVLGGFVGYGLRYVRAPSRLLLLLASAMAAYFGCARLSVDSAGALAVLVAAFVAGAHWRTDEKGEAKEEASLRTLWELFFQPLLFGLIGFELTFSLLSWRLVLLGLLVLAIGVAARTAVAFLAVMGSGMSSRERLFVALAWIPKATVQAALAPVALEMSRKGGHGEEHERAALIVFSLAVISILTTAPLGAAVIRLAAPLLLTKDTVAEESSKSTVEKRSGGMGGEAAEEMETLKGSHREDLQMP